ncbi:MAG: monovalent cation/H(+) antiporter subunit G [Alsobacter sp.]
MPDPANLVTILALLASVFFFVAGSVGLVRMPDTLTRIHSLTKADNIALGFIVVALLPQVGSAADAAKIVAVWVLVQVSSGAVAQLMGEVALAEQAMTPGGLDQPDDGRSAGA